MYKKITLVRRSTWCIDNGAFWDLDWDDFREDFGDKGAYIEELCYFFERIGHLWPIFSMFGIRATILFLDEID